MPLPARADLARRRCRRAGVESDSWRRSTRRGVRRSSFVRKDDDATRERDWITARRQVDEVKCLPRAYWCWRGILGFVGSFLHAIAPPLHSICPLNSCRRRKLPSLYSTHSRRRTRLLVHAPQASPLVKRERRFNQS